MASAAGFDSSCWPAAASARNRKSVLDSKSISTLAAGGAMVKHGPLADHCLFFRLVSIRPAFSSCMALPRSVRSLSCSLDVGLGDGTSCSSPWGNGTDGMLRFPGPSEGIKGDSKK